MTSEIFIYGVNSAGGRNIGIDIDGTRILVESRGEKHDHHVENVSRAIVEKLDALRISESERAAHRAKVEELSDMIQRANFRAKSARDALVAAIEGRRRFFGPVFVVPCIDGDWSGEVWLLDPEKRDRGYGLRFSSLRILREEHPELWIVRPDGDGILLDVCPMPDPDCKAHAQKAVKPNPTDCPKCGRHDGGLIALGLAELCSSGCHYAQKSVKP